MVNEDVRKRAGRCGPASFDAGFEEKKPEAFLSWEVPTGRPPQASFYRGGGLASADP